MYGDEKSAGTWFSEHQGQQGAAKAGASKAANVLPGGGDAVVPRPYSGPTPTAPQNQPQTPGQPFGIEQQALNHLPELKKRVGGLEQQLDMIL
ncbi:hypothetical protein NDU88_001638 [Pleurodeles waltl]|uniref:Uncharacterized protein n=1 Tax=Pleurodeles waltl TaxID=8319 RepID=A0AAV7NDZ0_PLEWA|nr:hypothetical protein NDU88_001638 [Pleurodeles waltl]